MAVNLVMTIRDNIVAESLCSKSCDVCALLYGAWIQKNQNYSTKFYLLGKTIVNETRTKQ